MSLDGAGLALSIVAEVRTLFKSLQERKACYEEVPIILARVDGKLSKIMAGVEDISTTIGANPTALPKAIHQGFVETLCTVKETLLHAEGTMKEHCDNTSDGNCFPFVGKKCKRFLRSKSMKTSIDSIEKKAGDAEAKLEHLRTQLCTALKIDTLQDKIKSHVSPAETFCPAFNVPMLAENIHLDFERKDANGSFLAPEAKLKSSVFISSGPRHITVARGAARRKQNPRPVHGVSGMAGVGKTMALIGLGHEEDIRAHFADGVLFMSIGANATVRHVTTELWKIMSVTGATESAAAVKSSKSLADAIVIASVWFYGRQILFLVDDIWPSSTCSEGYLRDLEGLLQGSPKSHMAISTRSLEIASKRGSHIDFGARDPCGPTSLAMFIAHVLPEAAPTDRLLECTRPVLLICDGLPIALSIAGAAVSMLLDSEENLDEACQLYVENIQAQISLHPGSSVLESAISLSLTALSKGREREGRGVHDATEFSFSELYESLCVLENQQFAPVSVLARMWSLSDARADDLCVSFKSMSLAKISTQVLDGRKQRGVMIHDLHLDFCRQSANRSGSERAWHQRLLDGHKPLDITVNDAIEKIDGRDDLSMLEYNSRPWWEEGTPNKEYVRKHLTRHLQKAGLNLELGSTVFDIRWISVQGKTGGVHGLLNDVQNLRAVAEAAGTNELQVPVKILSQLVVAIVSKLPLGLRVLYLTFNVYLFLTSETNVWTRRFLRQMKKLVPKPFLEPVLSLYRLRHDDEKLNFDLSLPGEKGFTYQSTDFSKCDQYCAGGSNQSVVVFEVESQSRIKWLRGHKSDVSIVRFSSDACKLISGSRDGIIIVWDWREKESPLSVLRGHELSVTCLCPTANDLRFFSGSDDGAVRMWDLNSGALCDEFEYGAQVKCVSHSSTSGVVAVGTSDGRLICRDWVAGRFVFEHNAPENCAILSVKFNHDGKMALCGNSRGTATAWSCSEWTEISSVNIPGSLTHIAIHADGLNILLGSSTGEIRHWDVTKESISTYNIAMSTSLSGLSFRKNGTEILCAQNMGFVFGWTGPMTNLNLDFSEKRDGKMYDFSLSNDGKRVATSTHDGMIRIRNCSSGSLTTSYPSPFGGSRRLMLSADGAKLASSSGDGRVTIWNADMTPTDADASFSAGDRTARCLSFRPDGKRLLVSMKQEVQIWNLDTVEMIHRMSCFGSLDVSYSSDGRFIIAGSTERAIIWDATTTNMAFDTVEESVQTLSISQAKQVIKTSCSYSHRLCPSFLRDTGAASPPITVDNFIHFTSPTTRPWNMLFCEGVFILNAGGLQIFKLLTE